MSSITLIPLHTYAKSKGLSKQGVYTSKTLPIVQLPIYAKYKGKFIQLEGVRKFVINENNP